MHPTDRGYEENENLWDEQWPSANQPGEHPTGETDTADELSPFPEVVGTVDPIASVRDAEPYMPPVDPPVVPGGREGVSVATGFGVSPLEEASEEPPPRGDDELRESVVETLRQDSLTSGSSLQVRVRDGVVHLRGNLSSVEEAEHAQWVVGELPGVVDVVDETTLEPAT